MGMRATGSTDYEVRDVLVPEGRWAEPQLAAPVVDEPLYRFPFGGAGAGRQRGDPAGGGRRARHWPAPKPAQSSRTLAERPVAGRRAAEVAGARPGLRARTS
jgi:hypothetical protein